MTIISACKEEAHPSLKWGDLPNIPDKVGFAGSFGGVSNNTLLVAGGANFPDGGAPWAGSKKVWHDQVFALEQDSQEWKIVGKLPRPLGYGVSISTDDGLLIIGGSNEEGHYSDVYRLRYADDSLSYSQLPSLPEPLANSAGVLLNNIVYVMGGTTDSASKEAEDNFWSLDLNDMDAGWTTREPWPGPSRMLAVAGADEHAVYLFSGAHLKDGVREYLSDSYRFSEERGWEKLPALPRSVVAAPTPAYTDANSNLLVFGGDDGSLADIDPQTEKHPGFSKAVLSFDPNSNEWSTIAEQPGNAAVTTSLVVWNGEVVIPGGEIRPAVRTTQVRTVIIE
ncbi:Kelch repeat-containing protein [Albibacterium profundi]|uniref:Galactose oxidase n=1 Tax=Albibacterium profundi TaxID=3134906 RepID=A0ABV5CEQ1_9SPHI